MICLQTKRHNPVTYHRLNPWKSTGEYYWLKEDMVVRGKRYKKAGIHQETTHLISNNAFYPPFLEEVKRLRESIGFKFIMDVDDYWIIDSWNPVYKEMQGETLKARVETMKAADILTCTHARLAEKLRELNPTARIFILPNGLDHTLDQWRATEVKDVSFGYIGGPTHKRDLEALKGVERKIDIFAPQYFRAKLQSKNTFNYTPQDKYGYLYEKFSVSLAPIYSTEFTSLKSDIKAVEAGFKNNMLIATRDHPYLDNPAIDLRSTYTEWNALPKLSLTEVQDKAGKLHEWATTHRKLETINEIRKQIIEA